MGLSLLKFTVFLLFLFSNCYAIEPVILNDYQDKYPIGLQLELLEDVKGNLTIADILSAEVSNAFIKSTKAVPNFGNTSSTIWARFKVKNNASYTKRWLIDIVKTQTNVVTLYAPKEDNSIIVKNAGRIIPYANRDIKHRNFVFNIDLDMGDEQEYYIKFISTDTVSIPIYIWEASDFANNDHQEQIVMGIYFGFILVMIIYNMFIFFSLKEKNYLYYVLFIASFLWFIGNKTGHLYEYYPSWISFFNNRIFLLSLNLTAVSGFIFTCSFLELKKYHRISYRIFYLLVLISTLLLPLSIFAPYRIVNKIYYLLIIIFFLVSFPVSIYCYKRGYKPARFYVLSFSLFSVAVLATIAYQFGILDRNFFTQYGIQAGTVILVIMLGLALADKINIFKEERLLASYHLEIAHQELKKRAEELEEKVKERTFDISMKNELLTMQKDELLKANETIKQSESLLIQQEKLAVLGDITSSVTHEISTPLLALTVGINEVKSTFKRLKCTGDGVGQYEKLINTLHSSLHVIRKQLVNMKDFIDFGAKTEYFDVNEALKITLNILNFRILSQMKIEKAFSEDLPKVSGEAAQINQVFMNIVKNATEGKKSEEVGLLFVSTDYVDGRVVIRIKDDGVGIPQNVLDHLFKDKFSTKENGAGLGLYLSKAILTKMGGRIEVDSEQGVGTTVSIYLKPYEQLT